MRMLNFSALVEVLESFRPVKSLVMCLNYKSETHQKYVREKNRLKDGKNREIRVQLTLPFD